jgi:hypothetical protein
LKIRGAKSGNNIRLIPRDLPLQFLVILVTWSLAIYSGEVNAGVNVGTKYAGSNSIERDLTENNDTIYIPNSSAADSNSIVTMTLRMGCSIFPSFFLAYALSGVCLESAVILQRLRDFSLHEAKSFCCDQPGHLVVHQGQQQRIACDRQLVVEHVAKLYNSVSEFNTVVQNDLRAVVEQQLRWGVFLFPPSHLLPTLALFLLSQVETAFLTTILQGNSAAVHGSHRDDSGRKGFIGFGSENVQAGTSTYTDVNSNLSLPPFIPTRNHLISIVIQAVTLYPGQIYFLGLFISLSYRLALFVIPAEKLQGTLAAAGFKAMVCCGATLIVLQNSK